MKKRDTLLLPTRIYKSEDGTYELMETMKGDKVAYVLINIHTNRVVLRGVVPFEVWYRKVIPTMSEVYKVRFQLETKWRWAKSLFEEGQENVYEGIKIPEFPYYEEALKSAELISQFPESFAENDKNEYYDFMKDVINKAKKFMSDEEVQELVNKISKEWLEKYREMIHFRANVASPAVVGPAKFPAAQMEKKRESYEKRQEALWDWEKKVLKGLDKKEKKQKIEEEGGMVKHIEKELEEYRDMLRRMKEINRVVRNKKLTREEKLKKIKEIGFVEAGASTLSPEDLLKPDYMGRIGYKDFELGRIRDKIKRLEERLEVEKMKEEKKGEVEISYERKQHGFSIVKDYGEDRVMIFFNNIPPADLRERLKRRGFRWSPKRKAWVRKLTRNAVEDARDILFNYYNIRAAISEAKEEEQKGWLEMAKRSDILAKKQREGEIPDDVWRFVIEYKKAEKEIEGKGENFLDSDVYVNEFVPRAVDLSNKYGYELIKKAFEKYKEAEEEMSGEGEKQPEEKHVLPKWREKIGLPPEITEEEKEFKEMLKKGVSLGEFVKEHKKQIEGKEPTEMGESLEKIEPKDLTSLSFYFNHLKKIKEAYPDWTVTDVDTVNRTIQLTKTIINEKHPKGKSFTKSIRMSNESYEMAKGLRDAIYYYQAAHDTRPLLAFFNLYGDKFDENFVKRVREFLGEEKQPEEYPWKDEAIRIIREAEHKIDAELDTDKLPCDKYEDIKWVIRDMRNKLRDLGLEEDKIDDYIQLYLSGITIHNTEKLHKECEEYIRNEDRKVQEKLEELKKHIEFYSQNPTKEKEEEIQEEIEEIKSMGNILPGDLQKKYSKELKELEDEFQRVSIRNRQERGKTVFRIQLNKFIDMLTIAGGYTSEVPLRIVGKHIDTEFLDATHMILIHEGTELISKEGEDVEFKVDLDRLMPKLNIYKSAKVEVLRVLISGKTMTMVAPVGVSTLTLSMPIEFDIKWPSWPALSFHCEATISKRAMNAILSGKEITEIMFKDGNLYVGRVNLSKFEVEYEDKNVASKECYGIYPVDYLTPILKVIVKHVPNLKIRLTKDELMKGEVDFNGIELWYYLAPRKYDEEIELAKVENTGEYFVIDDEQLRVFKNLDKYICGSVVFEFKGNEILLRCVSAGREMGACSHIVPVELHISGSYRVENLNKIKATKGTTKFTLYKSGDEYSFRVENKKGVITIPVSKYESGIEDKICDLAEERKTVESRHIVINKALAYSALSKIAKSINNDDFPAFVVKGNTCFLVTAGKELEIKKVKFEGGIKDGVWVGPLREPLLFMKSLKLHVGLGDEIDIYWEDEEKPAIIDIKMGKTERVELAIAPRINDAWVKELKDKYGIKAAPIQVQKAPPKPTTQPTTKPSTKTESKEEKWCKEKGWLWIEKYKECAYKSDKYANIYVGNRTHFLYNKYGNQLTEDVDDLTKLKVGDRLIDNAFDIYVIRDIIKEGPPGQWKFTLYNETLKQETHPSAAGLMRYFKLIIHPFELQRPNKMEEIGRADKSIEEKLRIVGEYIKENSTGAAGVKQYHGEIPYEEVKDTLKDLVRRYFNITVPDREFYDNYKFVRWEVGNEEVKGTYREQVEFGIDNFVNMLWNVAANGWDLVDAIKEWKVEPLGEDLKCLRKGGYWYKENGECLKHIKDNIYEDSKGNRYKVQNGVVEKIKKRISHSDAMARLMGALRDYLIERGDADIDKEIKSLIPEIDELASSVASGKMSIAEAISRIEYIVPPPNFSSENILRVENKPEEFPEGEQYFEEPKEKKKRITYNLHKPEGALKFVANYWKDIVNNGLYNYLPMINIQPVKSTVKYMEDVVYRTIRMRQPRTLREWFITACPDAKNILSTLMDIGINDKRFYDWFKGIYYMYKPNIEIKINKPLPEYDEFYKLFKEFILNYHILNTS